MDGLLTELARLFSQEGYTLYGVGGMVRNPLMGLPVSDIDVCSAMKPDDVETLCRKHGLKTVDKGRAFGVIEIHIGQGDQRLFVEHTTFRSDTYAFGGHRPDGVRFSTSIEEDAFRRDFSVNAIYKNILTGELVDPTEGLTDLKRGMLRTACADPDSTLRDDGLRIMRLARFACELGLSVDPATLASAKKHCDLLLDISAERLWTELSRLLLSDIRYPEVQKKRFCDETDSGEKLPWDNSVFFGLELLRETGALFALIPELRAADGFVQRTKYHRYDVLGHSIRTCACTPASLALRLAGLLHDVSKPEAFERDGNMYAHPMLGTGKTREILTRLRCPNDTADTVCGFVKEHMYDLNNTAKDSTIKKRFAMLGRTFASGLIEIRNADIHGSGVELGRIPQVDRWRAILAQMESDGTPMSVNELNCTGADIMEWTKLPPSPAVGKLKNALFMHCAVKPKDNNPKRLKKLCADLYTRSKNDSI